MTIEKIKELDVIEVLSTGAVQVRYAIRIVESGNVLASNYHREVLQPGSDLNGAHDKVKAVCKSVWTPEVIAAYRDGIKVVA